MTSTARAVPFTAPDHGICSVCSGSYPLQLMTGYLRRHGPGMGCPGGGKPPVKVKTVETLNLPDPT